MVTGAAESSAELMTLQIVARNALLIVEIGIGIEGVIANKFEGAAMPIIGPGFGDDADDAAGVAPVLGSVVAFENAEFSDGIRIGIKDDPVVE